MHSKPLNSSLQRQVIWQVPSAPDQQVAWKIPSPRATRISWNSSGFKSSIVKLLEAFANTSQFIDIGANVGQSMLEIWMLNSEVEYFGFEPNPQAFVCLQDLASALRICADLFPWACSAASVPSSFYASSQEDCSATLVPQIRPDTYAGQLPTRVAAYPLDQSLSQERLSSYFVMKIDVEGFENEVLIGAEKIVSSKRPFILCEVLHAHRETEIGLNNARKSQLECWLKQRNYRIMQVQLDPGDRNTLIGLEGVDEFPKNLLWKSSPHSCDYLFVPEESGYRL